MRGIVLSLITTGLLAGCGGTAPGEEEVPAADPGLQLASIALGEGRSLSFYELPGHGIITVAKGPRGAPLLARDALDGLSVTEAYRKLAGQEPPAALVEAARRIPDPTVTPMSLTDRAPELREAATDTPAPGGVEALGTPNTSWFVSNYCTGLNTEYDAMWCPTWSYSWANSGWGPFQKFYNTCGTTSDAPGTLWLEKWSNGAWQRLQTVNLASWQVSCAWGWGVGQYRSGISSAAAVLFSERYRYAIPNITAYLGTFPTDRSYPSFADDIQGITHDTYNWYLTRNTTNFWKDEATNGIIAKQAMTSINDDPPIRYSMPSPWYNAGFRHYGDLVQVNGLIYVAMDDGNGNIAGVGVFNTNLNYVGFNYLPGWSGGVAFIAHNPRDGLFYAVTNAFGATTLRGFQITVSGTSVSIVQKRSLTLMSNIPSNAWIQGGKISPRGNLYLSVGGGDAASGIYMIDVMNGYVQTFYYVPYGSTDEFEGLDLWDLDADQRLGALGQIHMQQINIDAPGFDDDYWLAHFRVDDPGKL